MITGQERICNLIDRLNLDTFPRSLMLVGPIGSGKHLICDYIASKFNLTIFDITKELELETIEEIYQRVQPYLYLIKINELSVKEENLILKFLEEPLKNSYIILLAETDLGILPTVLNRCQLWYLQNYKKEFLQTFLTVDNPLILDIAVTPGQVKNLCSSPFNEMVELADKIIDKIEIASLPNTLTLSNKLAWKDEKDKYEVRVFLLILLSRITIKWKFINDLRYVSAYQLTYQLHQNMLIKNVDGKALFEQYLINLRTLMRGSIL